MITKIDDLHFEDWKSKLITYSNFQRDVKRYLFTVLIVFLAFYCGNETISLLPPNGICHTVFGSQYERLKTKPDV